MDRQPCVNTAKSALGKCKVEKFSFHIWENTEMHEVPQLLSAN